MLDDLVDDLGHQALLAWFGGSLTQPPAPANASWPLLRDIGICSNVAQLFGVGELDHMTAYSALALRICLCLGTCILPAIAPWPAAPPTCQPLREGGLRSGEGPRHRRSLGRVPLELSDRLSCRSRPGLCEAAERDAKPRAVSTGGAVGLRQRRFSGGGGLLGGVLRGGPGRNYRQIGSLKEGEPVTLMGRVDISDEGFPGSSVTVAERPAINGAAFSARPEPSGPICTRPVLSLDCRYLPRECVGTSAVQKQTFLIVGHLAKPLSDAAFANAAARSGREAFWSLSHAPPATS